MFRFRSWPLSKDQVVNAGVTNLEQLNTLVSACNPSVAANHLGAWWPMAIPPRLYGITLSLRL